MIFYKKIKWEYRIPFFSSKGFSREFSNEKIIEEMGGKKDFNINFYLYLLVFKKTKIKKFNFFSEFLDFVL